MGSVQAGLSSQREFAKQTEHRAAPQGLMPGFRMLNQTSKTVIRIISSLSTTPEMTTSVPESSGPVTVVSFGGDLPSRIISVKKESRSSHFFHTAANSEPFSSSLPDPKTAAKESFKSYIPKSGWVRRHRPASAL